MELKERLKKIDEFFDKLSLEEFERMSLEAGLWETADTPNIKPSIELYDKTIDVIKERKNCCLDDFTTGYVIESMTTETLNKILSDPSAGFVLCKTPVAAYILDFCSLLRVTVYHSVSDEDIKNMQEISFSAREENNEPTGSPCLLPETNHLG